MSLSLISIDSVNTLGSIRSTLRKQESRTANQKNLALLGASISMIDQAQSIPAPLAIKAVELAEACLFDFDTEDKADAVSTMSDLRLQLRFVIGNERVSIAG